MSSQNTRALGWQQQEKGQPYKMGYYFFKTLSEDKLPELEKLVTELGLSVQCEYKSGYKIWEGYFPKEDRENTFLEVFYKPMEEFQIGLQFSFFPGVPFSNHKNNTWIKETVKKFIELAEAKKVYDCFAETYDIKEFE